MKQSIFKIISYITIAFWIFFTLLPIITVIPTSFLTSDNYYKTGVSFFSKDLSLSSYYDVVSSSEFYMAIGTTFLLIVLCVIFTTLFSSSVAYVMERFSFKGKNSILKLFFIASVIPLIAIQIYIYQVFNFFNLHNSIIGLAILYSVSDIVIIYMFRELISKIPKEVEKSARLFGASDIKVFFSIILPSLKEGILLVMIFKTIVVYNDFYLQFLFLPSKQTVSTYLYTFIGTFSISWPHICATIVLTLIPVVFLIVVLSSKLKNTVSTFDL